MKMQNTIKDIGVLLRARHGFLYILVFDYSRLEDESLEGVIDTTPICE